MQITITGPRGSGCTTLAAAVARLLTKHGQDVSIVAHDRSEVDLIWDTAKYPPEMETKARVCIVCGVEQEDEHDARHRSEASTGGIGDLSSTLTELRSPLMLPSAPLGQLKTTIRSESDNMPC